MWESSYYTYSNHVVTCLLCPHVCRLKNGEKGNCGARQNIDGKLYLLTAGRLCAQNVDPIEKKPLFHFLPGTNTYSIASCGCNLHCLNCQNYSISQNFTTNQSPFVSPSEVVSKALINNCRSISYTYTEPIIASEYFLEVAELAKQKGLKNVLVSSGYINPDPLANWINVLDGVNIDLKSFNNETYKTICGASLQPVLNTLIQLKQSLVWLEITCLIIPYVNDSDKELKQMFNWLCDNCFNRTPIHLSRFFPTYKMAHSTPTSIEKLKLIKQMAIDAGLEYVYLGNLDEDQNTCCPQCNTILIQRHGYRTIISSIIDNKCSVCGEELVGCWEH